MVGMVVVVVMVVLVVVLVVLVVVVIARREIGGKLEGEGKEEKVKRGEGERRSLRRR